MQQTSVPGAVRAAPPAPPAPPAVPAFQQVAPEEVQAVPADIPRPEYPRPDFQREQWVNLNGRWRFSFDPQNVGEQLRWYHVPHPEPAARTGEGSPIEDPFGAEILVPYPWESRLSGVGDATYKGVAWYQRSITAPPEWAASRRPVRWQLRPVLCFGAVDWSAKVWVNGRFVAEHDGGYTPFSIDLADYLRPGQPATLTVRVYDACDADTPLGKQTVDWYTHSGGIWQTVWLEGRSDPCFTWAQVTPHLDAGCATFRLGVQGTAACAGRPCRVRVESLDGAFPAVEREVTLAAGEIHPRLEVAVPSPRPWSPEDPHLYDCRLTLTTEAGEGDRVQTYFGLRSISTGRWEGRPYEFVLLNGEPVYLRGALDQAFHPDAIHGYPSDEVIRGDVQTAKDLGLNMLRCHIKINDPRYYYWCDRLGVLCMYDFPSASIYTPKARANWERVFREAMHRDYSHPCIFAWVLFNETWGLEEHHTPAGWSWVKEMYYLCKQLDSTRLVEDNSPYLWDHVTTDINTWHFYIGDYDRARRHVESVVSQTYEGSAFHYVGGVYGDVQGAESYKQGTQPLLNSEYAGISAWGGDRDISYSFKFLTSELRRHDQICGYVYTELTDVEWEHNGLLNYDRSPKEFGYDAFAEGMTVADLNGADFVGFDCPPCQTMRPGSTFKAPVFVSHWDRHKLAAARLRWQVNATDRFGSRRALDEGERVVAVRQYGVVEAGEIEVSLPDELCLVTVAIWLEDEAGNVRARNYVNVDVHSSRYRQEVETLPGGYALRFLPGDFLNASWLDPRVGPRGNKFGGTGPGGVEFALSLPEGLDTQAVKGLRLLFEGAARTARSRIDWKDPTHIQGADYPQTEQRKVSGRVTIWLNGISVGTVRFPDDPADARGVLSLHTSDNWEPASYGYLTMVEVDELTTRRILEGAQGGRVIVRFEVPSGPGAGGFNLYGARMGSTPVEPTLFIDL